MANSKTDTLSTGASQTQLPLSQSGKKAKKEPDFYVFRLIQEHPKYYESASIFPPKFVIPNKDTVLSVNANGSLEPRAIRYLDGYKTIFVDEQEVNGQPVPENITSRIGNEIVFENGFLRVPSYNKALIEYLKLNNQCEQQTNKFKMINSTYRLLDFSNTDDKAIEKGKLKDEAYDYARSAPAEDMIPHAKFLGIPFIHPVTNEERELAAIREDYKSKAIQNPEEFLKYATNPKVKMRFNVEKGLEMGIITTGLVKNQLHWAANSVFVTDLPSNLSEVDAIVDFIIKKNGDTFYKTLQTQL